MKFMVEIQNRGEFDQSFMALVPADTVYYEQLKAEGVMGEITMTADGRKCWVICEAESQDALQEMLARFPLYSRLQYDIFPLV